MTEKMKKSRLAGLALLAVVSSLACNGLPDEPVPLPPMPAVGDAVALGDEPAREFDFWLGEWSVQNKHVQRDGTWKDTGTAVARIQPVADGAAVLERWTGEVKGDPLIGFSLRAWDPALGKWVIYLNWHGGKPTGFFVMHGERHGERIDLLPPDDPNRTRYTFSEARQGSCQWNSARWIDGQWIEDWVMQFTRTSPPQGADAAGTAVEMPPPSAAKFPETRRLDALLGVWEGRAKRLLEDGSWEQGTARARVTSMIEGFGLLQFLDTSWGEKTLAALAWDSGAEGWVAVRADNRTPVLLRLAGSLEDGTSTFTGEGLRETWTRASEDRYRWERAVPGPDGTWQPVLVAELARSD